MRGASQESQVKQIRGSNKAVPECTSIKLVDAARTPFLLVLWLLNHPSTTPNQVPAYLNPSIPSPFPTLSCTSGTHCAPVKLME